ADFDRALEFAPDPDAVCGRGLLRTEAGDYRGGTEDAEAALRSDAGGWRLAYLAARVHAQASAQARADRRLSTREPGRVALAHEQRALALLRTALARMEPGRKVAFCRDVLARDTALRPLHGNPDFEQLRTSGERRDPL